MGLVDTEAVVLKSYNLGEADKILVCFTRRAGIVRGVARGARSLKSRFGAGIEPATIVNLTYFEKESQELVSIRQTEILRSFFGVIGDPDVFNGISRICELTSSFSPPHEPNEVVFRMLSACLDSIAHSPGKVFALVRYFELWQLKLAGFMPSVTRCAECGRTLVRSEGAFVRERSFCCTKCSAGVGNYFDAESICQLQDIMRLGPKEFASLTSYSNNSNREVSEFTSRLIDRALERVIS
jgi:DNA repair protein RecO (recombination protein O)